MAPGILTATDGPSSAAPVSPGTVYYAPLRIIYADQYGADPTGAADSTAALLLAQAAGGSGAYQIVLSAGTYVVGTSQDLGVFGRGQGMTGQGRAVTTLSYRGNGTCVAAFDSSFSSSLSNGGKFGGFTIDGTSAGASAVGMSWGNLQMARCHDIKVANFTGGSAVGLKFKNGTTQVNWSEEGEWTAINVNNCTVNVLFDTGSFDYSLFQFVILCSPGQDGVRLQNDASLEGCRLEVRGNFTAGAGNTGAVFALDRGNASGTSRIDGCQMYVNVECDGVSGTGHFTIKADGGSSCRFEGTGVLVFNDETVPFQGTSFNSPMQFGFSGRIHEHTTGFMSPGDGFAVQGGSLFNERGSLATAFPGTIFLKFGDFHAYQLANGANALVFSSLLTRVRRIELFLAQPASGAAGTVTWPANVYFQGGKPMLSVANNAIDRIRLTYLPADDKWFGEAVTGYVLASSGTAAGNLLKATDTGTGGFALQNGTPTILTWTAPNDGQLHRVLVFHVVRCTVAETGGAIVLNYTDPGGSAGAPQLDPGGRGTGSFVGSNVAVVVGAGTTVTVAQSSALTAGTASIWAEIWAT